MGAGRGSPKIGGHGVLGIAQPLSEKERGGRTIAARSLGKLTRRRRVGIHSARNNAGAITRARAITRLIAEMRLSESGSLAASTSWAASHLG